MKQFNLEVNETSISRATELESVPSNTLRYLRVLFDIQGDGWDVDMKYAIFESKATGEQKEVLLDIEDNGCYIPHEIVDEGGVILVNLCGFNAEDVDSNTGTINYRITTFQLKLVKSIVVPYHGNDVPTPDIFEQYIARVQALVKKVSDMTVHANTVASNVPASVEKTEEDDHYHLEFGIPKGASGVHVGTEEPTDPEVNVWIDPSGDPYTEYVPSERKIAGINLEDDITKNELKEALDINAIEVVIPQQATPSNKLADKSFVNSSIATETAHYIYKTNAGGEKLPFDSLAELEAYTGTVTNNDYAFVTGTDTQGNAYFDRYKASVSGTTVSWAKEYRLNNSSFTAEQWAAISSGITSGLVALIETALQPADLEDYYTKDETDELIESVIPAYDLIGTTSGTITILPNTSVRHTGTPATINLTLGTPETEKESEYRLTFVAGASTSLNVTAPTGYTVVYPDGQPTFTSGKVYELSFMAITNDKISCLYKEVV